MRIIKVNFGKYNSESIIVKLGETCVHCTISTKIIKPLSDRPLEGILKFKTFFSGVLKSGRDYYYSQRSEKINSFLTKVFKQSKILDFEAFNILIGKKAWSLTSSIFIIDDYGNLLDCVFLSVLIALRSFKKINSEFLRTNLQKKSFLESLCNPIIFKYIPIVVTIGLLHDKKKLIQPFILFDPSLEEERYIDGTITYAIDTNGNILTIEKNGGLPLTAKQMTYCLQLCYKKICQISMQLKKIFKDLEKVTKQIQAKIYSKAYNPIDVFLPISFKNQNETISSELEEQELTSSEQNDRRVDKKLIYKPFSI